MTRAVFTEVARLVRPGGLFLFHVNALEGWRELQLAPVLIPHRKTGEPFKRVWRGIARR